MQWCWKRLRHIHCRWWHWDYLCHAWSWGHTARTKPYHVIIIHFQFWLSKNPAHAGRHHIYYVFALWLRNILANHWEHNQMLQAWMSLERVPLIHLSRWQSIKNETRLQTFKMSMCLLPDRKNCGLCMRQECWECFPHHRGLVIPTCMSGSVTSGFLWSRWGGKRSRHSRCMRNSLFCVCGKRPMRYHEILQHFTN